VRKNYFCAARDHILPKSLFPLWIKRKSNIVLLTAREHFFCHQLLDKIYPNSNMFIGLWRLSNDNKHNYLSSKEYERLKQRCSKFMSELHKGQPSKNKGKKLSEEHKQRLSNARKGKKLSDIHKQKISDGLVGREFSEEHKARLREKAIGRVMGEDTCKKISESKKGKKLSETHRVKVVNALIGRKHSDETKQKISESNKGRKFSEEHKKHLIEASARRGKSAPNKGFKKVFYIKYKDNVFTIMELSKLLNVSEKTVLRYLKENKPINNFNLILEEVKYEKLSMGETANQQ
jgi:hypothetical protein